MITVRCSRQLHTMRHAKGFRSGRTSTGYSRRPAEERWLQLAAVALSDRELQRQWLAQGWRLHEWLCHSLRRGVGWDTP
jgi:hypothetical protein